MPHVQTTGFQPLTSTLPGHAHGRDRALQRSLRDSVADALDVQAKGRGIHGLAVAIRDKLAATDGGADAVPSLLETIDRALDDAAAKLAAQGVSREDIDAGVARFKSRLAREIGELTGGSQPVATEKSALAAREVVKERLSLDILTAEGDKVSIRFKSVNVTEVAAATAANESGSATAIQAQVIARGRFKVEVDGDLNEAERAAIGDLLDKVDDIANEFFSGDVQAAFSAAARVGLESEALSAFDLRLSYSRSLAAVKTYAGNARLGGQPAATPPTPVEAPKLPEVTPAPVDSATSAPVAPVATEAVAVAPVEPQAPAVEGIATSAAVAQNTARAASAMETITQFAKDVLERLDKDDESDAPKFSLRWKVEFMLKAFGSVALTPTEQKAADALGIALDGELPRLV